MGLNDTPSANRVHIGFFGMRNAGKSSVVNAVTNQELSIVSDVKGTTTDPVLKSMELLPLGPVVIIDTPGMDDEGQIGEMRVKRAKQILNKTDVAVLIVDSVIGKCKLDEELIELFAAKNIPYIVVYNKSDISSKRDLSENEIAVSAKNKTNIDALKEKIASFAKCDDRDKLIFDGFIGEEDMVILVTPIDESAPKGRMILPQVQAIRDILDQRCMCMVTQTEQLSKCLSLLKQPPRVVITDSQAFGTVKKIVPDDIMLSSFSILFAKYKGMLDGAVEGVKALDELKDGDKILISEGCTHHRQCNDIGAVKMPAWIREYTGRNLEFEYSSGLSFPEDLSNYALIVHCGSCMLGEREVIYRQKCAGDQNIPFTNYGIAISYMNGILKRSLEIFPYLYKKL